MKVLNIKQTVSEFNENLKEGIKVGGLLVDLDQYDTIVELSENLNYCLKWQELQKRELPQEQ